MTIPEILADARESMARLTVNGLCSRDHAEKLVREDALAIFDRMAAEVTATAQNYQKQNPLGGPAVIFDAMASRVRAGESFYHVLADFGFQLIPANTELEAS